MQYETRCNVSDELTLDLLLLCKAEETSLEEVRTVDQWIGLRLLY